MSDFCRKFCINLVSGNFCTFQVLAAAGIVKVRLLYPSSRTLFASSTATALFLASLVVNTDCYPFKSNVGWQRNFTTPSFTLMKGVKYLPGEIREKGKEDTVRVSVGS